MPLGGKMQSLVQRIVRPRSAIRNLHDRTQIFDQVVMLGDILPDLCNARPLDASFMRQQRVIGLVDRFDGAGMAVFEDSHGN